VEALKKLRTDPVHTGYLQALGTVNTIDGWGARVEAGVHPWNNATAFAAASLDRNGPGAEVGLRWDWDW
jgi:hypothetical protein